MELYITLYHDLVDDTFMTEDDFEDYFKDRKYDSIAYGERFPFTSYEHFAEYMESCGELETMIAYPQNGQEIFPYYYSVEKDSVCTAWDMYRSYIEQHDFRDPSDTFANFMEVSPYESFNRKYGFYKN